MKFIRFIAILTLLLVSVGTSGVARAEPISQESTSVASAPATTSPWFTGWADKNTSADVGSYPSITYNPVDGLPYISYYDAVNKKLMLANPVSSGGNCGDNNLWMCQVVDGNSASNGKTDGDVGRYSSIAFWRPTGQSTVRWKLGIAYYDATNNALKLAVSTQELPSGFWTFTTIDSSASASELVGAYTSIKFNSLGVPIIAYYNQIYYQGNLQGWLDLAMPSSGSGNCGPGNTWQCDQVDGATGSGVGQYASLDLGYNDGIYIAYYDSDNGDLRYAYYATPGNGNCGSANAYTCTMVDGNTGNVGMSAALTAPRFSNDHVRIAYYNTTSGNLNYAIPTSAGTGNCGGNDWSCISINKMGAGLLQAGVSMALDADGDPIIAYEDDTGDPVATLSIARPVEAIGNLMGIGNCGPIVGLYHTWQCDTLDDAAYGGGHVTLAKYTSVAVGPLSGLATIAYYEDNSFYNTDYLKVAFQRLQVFLPLVIK